MFVYASSDSQSILFITVSRYLISVQCLIRPVVISDRLVVVGSKNSESVSNSVCMNFLLLFAFGSLGGLFILRGVALQEVSVEASLNKPMTSQPLKSHCSLIGFVFSFVFFLLFFLILFQLFCGIIPRRELAMDFFFCLIFIFISGLLLLFLLLPLRFSFLPPVSFHLSAPRSPGITYYKAAKSFIHELRVFPSA